jgi:hypothetical protein
MKLSDEFQSLALSLDPRMGKPLRFDFVGFRRAMAELRASLTDEQRAYWTEKMEGPDYERFR